MADSALVICIQVGKSKSITPIPEISRPRLALLRTTKPKTTQTVSIFNQLTDIALQA